VSCRPIFGVRDGDAWEVSGNPRGLEEVLLVDPAASDPLHLVREAVAMVRGEVGERLVLAVAALPEWK
jgi:hypothetical protein